MRMTHREGFIKQCSDQYVYGVDERVGAGGHNTKLCNQNKVARATRTLKIFDLLFLPISK